MNATEIEWTDRTWNPVRGCSLVSAGCESCYAMKQAHRFSGKGQHYEGLTKLGPHGPRWTGKIRLVPENLDQPLKITKPQKIFVNSMSDLFHEDVPFEFIDQVVDTMKAGFHHTYQILTKRPQRMLRYLAPLGSWITSAKHIWWGVSVEDQKTANERIPLLLQTRAAVRWISAEPLLGSIDLEGIDCFPRFDYRQTYEFQRLASGNPDPSPIKKIKDGIDWVVVGGESGPKARPMSLEWVRSIRDQCQVAGVPFFMKQLSQATLRSGFKDISNFPEDLRIREFPDTTPRATHV